MVVLVSREESNRHTGLTIMHASLFSLFLQKRARQSSTYKPPKTSKDAIGLTHTCIAARAPARRVDRAIL